MRFHDRSDGEYYTDQNTNMTFPKAYDEDKCNKM